MPLAKEERAQPTPGRYLEKVSWRWDEKMQEAVNEWLSGKDEEDRETPGRTEIKQNGQMQ